MGAMDIRAADSEGGVILAADNGVIAHFIECPILYGIHKAYTVSHICIVSQWVVRWTTFGDIENGVACDCDLLWLV